MKIRFISGGCSPGAHSMDCSRSLLCLAGLIVSIATAIPVLAQQSDSTAGGGALAEIIVTAEKRSENLQSAPTAITRVAGDELQTLGVDNIIDMSGLFPSARFEPTGYAAHLYVRGIGAEQDRITVDQLVNLSLDGVILPREMGSIPLIDLRDVELLPGPQGTLYGASSVGGVLAIQGNRPEAGSENKLLVEEGNYATFHVTDVQNVALSDRVSLRGAVDYVRHSAYQTTGDWTADALTARAGLTFSASDLFTGYVWTLVHNDDSVPQSAGTLGTNGQWIPRHNPWDEANACVTKSCNGAFDRPNTGSKDQEAHDYIVAGQFDWHFDGFTITDVPSILHSQLKQALYFFVFSGNYNVNNHQLTNELRISSDSQSPLNWLGGLYLYQNRADQLFDVVDFSVPQLTVKSAAPYAQATYAINSSLRAIVGARYTATRKDASFELPNVLPETAASWSSVDGKAGLEYDVNPSAMAYATLQTGSSPGTLDGQDPVEGRPTKTRLTKLYSLTAGWKSRLFDNRVQLNNEMFYYDYRDFLIQTVVCGAACPPFNNVFLNAPKLTSWGDQLDIRWLVTPNDQFTLDVAYTNAKTGHWITNAGADLSDQRMLDAPEMTTTVGLQHTFNMHSGGSMVFGVNSSIVSGYYADFGTQPGGPVHSTVLNQRAYSDTGMTLVYHAPGDKWTVGAWAKNLEDKAQIGPGSTFNFGPVGGIVPFGGAAPIATAPRTYGVRVSFNQ